MPNFPLFPAQIIRFASSLVFSIVRLSGIFHIRVFSAGARDDVLRTCWVSCPVVLYINGVGGVGGAARACTRAIP